MDGIQWACSDFIIPKRSGHRLTLCAWCLVLFPSLSSSREWQQDAQGWIHWTALCLHHKSLTCLSHPFWMEMFHLRAMPLVDRPKHTPLMPPQTAKLHPSGSREERARQGGSVALPLGARVDGTHQSPSSASHPEWVSIHFTIIQMVCLWQCLAALLPAPWGTLAGGGPPTMSDDVSLLQAVAEGCLTKYSRHHLSRAQMSRK